MKKTYLLLILLLCSCDSQPQDKTEKITEEQNLTIPQQQSPSLLEHAANAAVAGAAAGAAGAATHNMVNRAFEKREQRQKEITIYRASRPSYRPSYSFRGSRR